MAISRKKVLYLQGETFYLTLNKLHNYEKSLL